MINGTRVCALVVTAVLIPGVLHGGLPVVAVEGCRFAGDDLVLTVSVETSEPILVNLRPPWIWPLHREYFSLLWMGSGNMLVFDNWDWHRSHASGNPLRYYDWLWDTPDSATLGAGGRLEFELLVSAALLERLGSSDRQFRHSFVHVKLLVKSVPEAPKAPVYFRDHRRLDPQPDRVTVPAFSDPARREPRERRDYGPFGRYEIRDLVSERFPLECSE